MKNLKKKLKDEIYNGLDNMFKLLGEAILDESGAYNEYIVLKASYKNTSRRMRMEVLSRTDYRLEENKIINNVLDFIDSLNEKDIKPSQLKKSAKDALLEKIDVESKIYQKYRNPSPFAQKITSAFNHHNLIVGNSIELNDCPQASHPNQIDTYGWDAFDKGAIQIGYEKARFDIGGMSELFEIDEKLIDTSDKKFSLSDISGGLIDNSGIRLKVQHTYYYIIRSLLNTFPSKLPEDIILKYGSLDPLANHIPHSLCLHNFIFLDDGNILCKLRARDLGYHADKLSFSQEEQLSDDDFDQELPTAAHLMARALCEEIFPLSEKGKTVEYYNKFLAPITVCMRIWSLFVEAEIFNFTLMGFTKLNISVEEYKILYKNWKNTGTVDKEGTMYFTNIDNLKKLLKTGTCEIEGVFNGKKKKVTPDMLHPTSLYRIYKFLVGLREI